ncbi:MAG: YitT family protein [Clostridia bacterium]|nr:YitT family protein [Clostridia bacterium]
MQISKKAVLDELKGYLFMLLGCIAYGSSTSLFLADNEIIAGGVTGLAVLINYLNPNILIGMISIAINVPILIFGVKFQGWKFVIRCLITVATLGVVTDLLGILFPDPLTTDGVLASLYGGICQGIGIGLFVRYEFSSGGTELLGRLIARFIKALNIPVCVGILDGIIVVVGSIVTQNPSNMLHALIVVFLSTKVSEMILVGFEKSKLCIIITDKGEELSEALLKNSPRGVTMLDGQGMYTHKDHNVLLTCVKNQQLTQLKQIVKSVDEHAFIIINESAEVRGQGFQSLNQDEK